MVSKVEIYSPESTAAYRKKLEDKLKEILGSSDIDEQRILTEAAKMCIRDRLYSAPLRRCLPYGCYHI